MSHSRSQSAQQQPHYHDSDSKHQQQYDRFETPTKPPRSSQYVSSLTDALSMPPPPGAGSRSGGTNPTAPQQGHYNLSLFGHQAFSASQDSKSGGSSSSSTVANAPMPFAAASSASSSSSFSGPAPASRSSQMQQSQSDQNPFNSGPAHDLELDPSWLLPSSSAAMAPSRSATALGYQSSLSQAQHPASSFSEPQHQRLVRTGPIGSGFQTGLLSSSASASHSATDPFTDPTMATSITPQATSRPIHRDNAPRAGGTFTQSGRRWRPVSESFVQDNSFQSFRDVGGIEMTPQAERRPDSSMAPLSPTSAASLSPVNLTNAFPPGMSDSNFLRAIFEQQNTPSLQSTNLPPDGTLGSTDASGGVLQHVSPSAPSRPISSQSLFGHGPGPGPGPGLDRTSRSFQGFGRAHESILKHVAPSASDPALRLVGAATSHVQHATGLVPHEQQLQTGAQPQSSKSPSRPLSTSSLLLATQNVTLAGPQDQPGQFESRISPLPRQQQPRPHSDIFSTSSGSSGSRTTGGGWGLMGSASLQDGFQQEQRVASTDYTGLGLNLNLLSEKDQEMVEQLMTAEDDGEMRDDTGDGDDAMQCDEMGRLLFAPVQRRGSYHSASASSLGVGSTSSLSRGSGSLSVLHTGDHSWGTADTSIMSNVSSSMDKSFLEETPVPGSGPGHRPRPPGTGMQRFATTPSCSPTPSLQQRWEQHGLMTMPAAVDARGGIAMPMLLEHDTDGKVADFSEFGESVPIDLMADDRWRTWPRNRAQQAGSEAGMSASTLSHQASYASEMSTTHSMGSRSRLLAEPYVKSQRSGRPSSSTSTSSWSSTSAMAGLDSANTPWSAGPTRPRSTHLSAGASGGGVGSGGSGAGVGGGSGSRAGGSRVGLEKASTVSALRRARGQSHGSFASSGGGVRQDGLDQRRFSMVGMQRVTSMDDSIGAGGARKTPRSSSEHEHGRSSSASSSSKVGFNEVSEALDTLRMFLHQKDDSAGAGAGAGAGAAAFSSSSSSSCSPSALDPRRPMRTLRHAKGTLPPRGSIRIESVGGSREEDRLAVLQDLSERVLRLKQASEQQQQQQQQQQRTRVPPPQQPQQPQQPQPQPQPHGETTPSRREMHVQYLRQRKESSGS